MVKRVAFAISEKLEEDPKLAQDLDRLPADALHPVLRKVPGQELSSADESSATSRFARMGKNLPTH
jgi:hypothetical protein